MSRSGFLQCVCVFAFALTAETASAQQSGRMPAVFTAAFLQPEGDLKVDFDREPSSCDQKRVEKLIEAFLLSEKKKVAFAWNVPQDETATQRSASLDGRDGKPNFLALSYCQPAKAYVVQTVRPLTAEETKAYEDALAVFVETMCLSADYFDTVRYRFCGRFVSVEKDLTIFVIEINAVASL